MIKAGPGLIWFWVVIEPTGKEILSFHTSKERNMFVADRFLSTAIERYRIHSVSSDGGTWYPQACKFLNLHHHLHSSFEKSIIERTM
ncbi:MAG TPA: DDE-type integrase/transposase/recombinase [Candidatus Nitrosocosmicus sp.]